MKSRQLIIDSLLDYVNSNLGFRPSTANRDKLEVKLDDLRLLPRWPDLESFHRDFLLGESEAKEALIKAITVNHTYFFRERHQIGDMISLVRSQGIAAPALWCAASSTGEEAYSLAILLLEEGKSDFRIVASDVNSQVLHAMNRGVYHCSRLEHLPKQFLKKYFTSVDERHWRVIPKLREHLAIKRVNLAQAVHFNHPFDFIFCRNVFIYFDNATRKKALASLSDNLRPGGSLFLGLTEGLLDVPPGFERTTQSGYRRLADGKSRGR